MEENSIGWFEELVSKVDYIYIQPQFGPPGAKIPTTLIVDFEVYLVDHYSAVLTDFRNKLRSDLSQKSNDPIDMILIQEDLEEIEKIIENRSVFDSLLLRLTRRNDFVKANKQISSDANDKAISRLKNQLDCWLHRHEEENLFRVWNLLNLQLGEMKLAFLQRFPSVDRPKKWEDVSNDRKDFVWKIIEEQQILLDDLWVTIELTQGFSD